MRNKKIIGIGMIITLVLVAVLVMATVTSVTLQAPSDGAWTNKLYTDLNFSFIFSGNSSATCILKMGFNDVSGNNLTDVYSASVTNNTPTTFTSNTSIPEGQHAWLVSCDAVGSSSRIIGVDRTIPSTITDAPTSWQKNDVTIIFTQNADDGLSSIDYYGCSGITSTPCTIQLLPGFPPISIFVNNEGNNTVRYYAKDAAGNIETTKNIGVLIDKTVPSINLIEPNNSAIFLNQNTFNFKFNVTDALSSTLNCSLKINNVINETDGTVANNTPKTFANKLLPEGTANWLVQCTDLAGNTNTSVTRNMIVNVTPDKAVVFTPTSLVNESSINIYGFVNRAGQNTNVTVYVQQDPDQNKGSQLTTYDAALLGNTTVFNLSVQNTTILYLDDINGEAPPGFAVGNFVDFNHQEPYLLRHQIVAMEYYPWGIQLNITPQLRAPISIGENVYSYNQSQPTGWFNISVSLIEGNNTIKVESRRLGTISPASDSYTVFKDTTPPSINLTNVINYTTTTPTINFTVNDSYAVNVSSIIVNISNATNSTIFNSTQVNCTTLPTCKVQPNLSNGYHNITVTISDVIGNTNTATKEFLIDTQAPQISLVSPADLYIEELSRNKTFSFNVTDDYSSTLNCTVYLNNTNTGNLSNSSAIIVANGGTNQTTFTNLTDATYNWWVTCIDGTGNQNQSEKRTITFNNTPIYAKIEQYSEVISTNSLNLVGVIGKADTMINFTVTQDEKIPQITQS
ncbi:MAG: hypothetical protein KJ583_00380, partial [Nanoarchaeota archaeon]|nr:hypothetical protein [Nanoarchaeota archaeon]MBU1603745.1 hypothetical protein [Nanoarchaeota archaeon]